MKGTRSKSPRPAPPVRREIKARITNEVARRVRDGHPWIFTSALKGRDLPVPTGQCLDVLDQEGRFVGRALVESGGSPVMRVFTRREGQELDRAYVDRVLQRATALRKRLLDPGPRACYRVLNGDSEGLPGITVDRYAEYLVLCEYSVVAERYMELLKDALVASFQPAAIYLQRRHAPPDPASPRPRSQLLHGAPAPTEVVVEEGPFRFATDVTAPVGTGIFPDMRPGRQEVARLAGGCRVLNCFSYTGAFSVVAAASGASEVVSVDSSSRAHTRARRNFEINGLDAGDRRFEFLTGDAFATMTRLAQRGRSFDLLVLDPPTFSSVKGRAFTVVKDYAELLATALPLAVPGGLICLACNAAKISAQDLDRAVGIGSSRAGREVLVVRSLGQPEDYPCLTAFPEGQHLKIFLLQAV